MENSQSADIGALLSALTQNPAALSMIGNLMENINKKPPPPPEPKTPDLSALLGLLGGAPKEAPTEKQESSPFGSKEEIQNRIALLNAVKPFLSIERQEKLKLIIKLMKLSELGELATILGKLS